MPRMMVNGLIFVDPVERGDKSDSGLGALGWLGSLGQATPWNLTQGVFMLSFSHEMQTSMIIFVGNGLSISLNFSESI